MTRANVIQCVRVMLNVHVTGIISMLCKVVKYGSRYVISHTTERYFNIGECALGDEFNYAWYPIMLNVALDIRNAIRAGFAVYVNDIDDLKDRRLVTRECIDITTDDVNNLSELQPLYDTKLELLDSVSAVEMYTTLALLVKTISSDELSSAEKCERVNSTSIAKTILNSIANVNDDIIRLESGMFDAI